MCKAQNKKHEAPEMERDSLRRQRLATTVESLVILSKIAGLKVEARKDRVLVRRNPQRRWKRRLKSLQQ